MKHPKSKPKTNKRYNAPKQRTPKQVTRCNDLTMGRLCSRRAIEGSTKCKWHDPNVRRQREHLPEDSFWMEAAASVVTRYLEGRHK